MDADGAPRNAEARLTVEAAPVLALLQSDVATRILRLAARLDALLVTKRVARTARAVAPVLRRLIWQDRILKGAAILKVTSCAFSPDGQRLVTARASMGRRGSRMPHSNSEDRARRIDPAGSRTPD